MNPMDVAKYCEAVLRLDGAVLGDEYFYSSLSLCVIDAVFSINIRYEITQKVVENYCQYFKLPRMRTNKDISPPKKEQQPLVDFIRSMDELGLDYFTNNIYRNRNRTSATNGILKTEAAYLFAVELNASGVNYFQDVSKVLGPDAFAERIKSIRGQGSGISLKYFFMLSGEDSLIKPDRWILDFLQNIYPGSITRQDAEEILTKTCGILHEGYNNITPRLLDNQIWKYQRGQKKGTACALVKTQCRSPRLGHAQR